MSRDVFPEDPRDAAGRHSAPQRSPDRSDALSDRNPAPEVSQRSQTLGTRERHPRSQGPSASLRAYYVRDRSYLLRDSELHSLAQIGIFRVVAAGDLAQREYQGDRALFERDIRRLTRQGLLNDQTIPPSRKKRLRVLTLTKTGHRLLNGAHCLPEDQVIYHGLRKPREAKHDARLCRLYQKEAERIERTGGKPLRVVLDYEIKRNLNRDLARLGNERNNLERKRPIAEKYGLRVVDGKIPVPDLRVEYETADLEIRHIDLELATGDYRPRGLAEKARAGFALFSPAEDAARLRRILADQELRAGILSL